jgi:uncharacterized protein with HEPN domain
MERDPALLLDMLLSAKDALQFSAELTWETFQASALHQYAIAKALENIGEAARKVSNATKEAHPEIPWSAIVALRHRIAHDYFSLDLLRIWDIVQNDLPALVETLEPIVPVDEG